MSLKEHYQRFDVQAFQADWYREHGNYPKQRIRRENGCGRLYVVGDWSWNRLYPDNKEFIDAAMSQAAEAFCSSL